MKIIFFGSSDFGVPVLEGLSQTEDVVLVVTQPDREKGRHLKLSQTAITSCAEKNNIKVFHPAHANSGESIEYLKGFKPDLFIVVSFGQILCKPLLDIPKFYALNMHGSLLPKYRGAAPINWAIANGDKETGVTIIRMNEKMDEGDIILQEAVLINEEDDAISLSGKLSKKGVSMILDAVRLIGNSDAEFRPQENNNATYAPKLKKEDGLIDWKMPADSIHNRIRAFVPWPGCHTYWGKKLIKIWKADAVIDMADEKIKPGVVHMADKNGILVKTGKGYLNITALQIESKRKVTAGEFLLGHRGLSMGSIFSDH